MSASLERNQACGSGQQPMDIPVVNIPDYPDRIARRGLMKPLGATSQLPKQGLTAPTVVDVSSSGPIMPSIFPNAILL